MPSSSFEAPSSGEMIGWAKSTNLAMDRSNHGARHTNIEKKKIKRRNSWLIYCWAVGSSLTKFLSFERQGMFVAWIVVTPQHPSSIWYSSCFRGNYSTRICNFVRDLNHCLFAGKRAIPNQHLLRILAINLYKLEFSIGKMLLVVEGLPTWFISPWFLVWYIVYFKRIKLETYIITKVKLPYDLAIFIH